MAGFSDSLKGVGDQLRQMTRSQQVALLLGALLIAGSLAWMVQWAATPEMTPLLAQPLTSDELAQVTAGLEALNQKYQVVGSQVLVSSGADRAQLLARLQQSGKMPQDTSIGFAALVRENNPWLSQAENNRRWTVALQEELSGVLSKFTGVEIARVVLDVTNTRQGFSRHQRPTSASVAITMRGGLPVPRDVALSAAQWVSGAVPHLALQNVAVVDSTGRPAIDWQDEAPGGVSALARLQAEEERRREEAIRESLGFALGLRVNVQVVLSHTSRQSASSEVAEGAPTQTRTHEESSGQRAASGQPGVQPNTGEAVSAGGEGEFRTLNEREDTLQPSITETTEITPAGKVEEAHASIGVSHLYLTALWKHKNPDATGNPTDAQLEAEFAEVRTRMLRQVSKLVFPPRPEQVAIDWYFDASDPSVAGVADAALEAGAADAAVALAARYAPAGVLGLLALLSLFVMLRMSRQAPGGEAFGLEIGLSKDALEASRRAQRDVAVGNRRAEAQKAAEAVTAAIPLGSATEPMLEAQEVDEKMVQVNQMLAQVATFVKQDEQGIAALVERWVDNR